MSSKIVLLTHHWDRAEQVAAVRSPLALSAVYSAGCAVLSFTSISSVAQSTSPIWWGGVLGLGLIALGTGGIKPCVASFGGDQIAHKPHLIQGYFSAFYFAINAGSLISTLLTPKLRANVSCFGDNECYPLAFGLPSLLMFTATVIFFLGRKSYVQIIPKQNVIVDTYRVWKIGISAKIAALRKGSLCFFVSYNITY